VIKKRKVPMIVRGQTFVMTSVRTFSHLLSLPSDFEVRTKEVIKRPAAAIPVRAICHEIWEKEEGE
jgi:hypothetical protein